MNLPIPFDAEISASSHDYGRSKFLNMTWHVGKHHHGLRFPMLGSLSREEAQRVLLRGFWRRLGAA